MSPVRVTWQRTLGRARNLRSTGLFVAGFLSAVGGIFAFSLAAADGGTTGVVALWALAAGKVLPVLAALLAMEAWSDELYSGRSDLLLSAPVATRDLTFGKFAGVWTVMMAAVVLSLALSLGALNFFSDTALAGCTFAKMVLAVFALALQGLLWAAVAVAASAFFRSPAAAAGVSLALMSVLPRGLWLALVRWRPEGAAALGEMPFDAQVADMASGVFPVGMLFGYLLLIAVALLVGSREVELLRYSGAGSLRTRLSTRGVQVLAVVFGVFAVGFLSRLTVSLDLTAGYGDMRFSARTLEILSESRADMNATCFMPRSDARFPAVSHLLRALRREVGAGAGVVLSLDFVDPRWDIGEAERLSRSGVAAPSIVFSRARRRIVLPLTEDFGERVCASAMLQLSLPPQRRNVYWTHGHGEAAFDD